jgi:hypothetical protein
MSRLKEYAKAVIPGAFRKSLKAYFRRQYRNYIFWRSWRKYLKDPYASATRTEDIAELLYGWGNEKWSPSVEYIMDCLQHARQTEGPILECGSGLCTLLLGIVAQCSGNVVWTLEHNRLWGDNVKNNLAKYSIKSVRLCVNALRDYDDFCWYAPPLNQVPDNFSLVVCDGPPGETRGGRYGLLPIMRNKLTSGCVILLDDAGRPKERETVGRWAKEAGTDYEIKGSEKPYAKLVMP